MENSYNNIDSTGNNIFQVESTRKTAGYSVLFALSAIVLSFFVPIILPLMLGSLAIVFAILSKGGASRFVPPAKIGFILGMICVAVNLILVAAMSWLVYLILTDPSFVSEITAALPEDYATTFTEMVNQLNTMFPN